MKKDKQMKNWSLSEIDYEAIASFIWADKDMVKRIFEKYGYEPIGLIILSNIYLVENNMIAGKIIDLKKIATSYSKNGLSILNCLFSSKFFEKKGILYYSTSQLEALGMYKKLTKKFIQEEENALKNISTVYPPKKITNTSYMKKVINNIISHVNRELPEHIECEIDRNNFHIKGFNQMNFYKLINAYICIDSSYIGFVEMLNIQLKILHKDKKVLLNVLKHNKVWVYDKKNGIIYDPVQRVKNGLPETPSPYEIKMVYERRKQRYIEILNLK